MGRPFFVIFFLGNIEHRIWIQSMFQHYCEFDDLKDQKEPSKEFTRLNIMMSFFGT
jgi:hypothetical protein